MPFLSHCVVIGDDRKYLTMLVTLKCEVRIDGKKGKGREGRGGEGRGNMAMCGELEGCRWKSLIPLCFNVPRHPIIRTCTQTHAHTIYYTTQMDDSNLPSDRLDKVSLSVMASIGSKSATVSDAREDPLVDQYIQQGMMRANERALSRAHKVQVRRLVRT